MRIKNLTPFLFGKKLCSRTPPQPEMTAIVRAKFVLRPGQPVIPTEGQLPWPEGLERPSEAIQAQRLLGQGNLTGEVFGKEDDDREGEVLYPGDFADFKPSAEVMLRGHCYLRSPKPTATVRFEVGTWAKDLLVVGPRVWVDRILGGAMSKPVAFSKMPLDYAHAFGGPGYSLNPVGTGYQNEALPNVEDPQNPITSSMDCPRPASFAPINPNWPVRSTKRGTKYDESYQKERAPYYPVDFDWSYFCSAPDDQQLKGYLKGDEELRFVHLHPAQPDFKTKLPGLRIRVFVYNQEGQIHEVVMRLDTLFVDLDGETLYMTWRGLTPATTDDLSDFPFALIASESLTDTSLSVEEYAADLTAFARDPLGLQAISPDNLQETTTMAEAFGRGQGLDAVGEIDAERPITSLLSKLSGHLEPDAQKQIGRTFDELYQKAPDRNAVLEALKDALKLPPVNVATGLPSEPWVSLGGVMRDVARAIDFMKQGKMLTPEVEQQLTAILTHPALQSVDPTLKKRSNQEPLAQPGPGQDLSGQDLTERDLSGSDLSDAKLEGAILDRANLRGARLCRANLKGASLAEADLREANLDEACLDHANFTRSVAEGASFSGATVDMSNFAEADLRHTTWANSKGRMPSFLNTRLNSAKANQTQFEKAIFDEADLEDADFSDATLTQTLFRKCNAKRMRLDRTLLDATSFMESNLTGASVVKARGEGTIWLRAVLDQALFHDAVLPHAHLMEASLIGARLSGADLREARLSKAHLGKSDLSKTNLMGADFRKADLTGARFRHANLYDAKFLEAVGSDVDFAGATLGRANFQRAKVTLGKWGMGNGE